MDLKRFFAVLLIAAVFAAAAVMPAAYAAGTPKFYVEAPSSAKVGDTITVSAKVSGDYTAHLLTMHMSYDPASFEYVSHTRGPVLDAAGEYGMAICEKAADKPTISVGILYAGDEGLSAEGTIFEAKFKVLSTSASNPQLKLEVPEFGYMPLTSPTSTPIQHTVQNATVSVSGGSGGVAPTVTETPIAPPAGPGETHAPSNTAAPNITAAPGGDTPVGTEGSDPANSGSDATDLPVLDPSDTGKDGPSLDGKDNVEGRTDAAENADDNSGSKNNNSEKSGGALKAVLIALGCLLAVGLGWLGVHFLKKAREAHEQSGK